jgi:hypothetical protein
MYGQSAYYQQYVGIKGVSPITAGQYENLVLVRSSFSDNVEPGIFTATIDWGDTANTRAGLYTYHNRLIYKNATGVAFNNSLSGKACGGHIYTKTGDYTITMTISKDSKVFGIVTKQVHVDSIYDFPTNTVFTGSLGEEGQLADHHRALRLRKEHVALHPRRADPAERGTRAHRWP